MEDRFDFCMEIENWQKAADVALRMRDQRRLNDVVRLSKDQSVRVRTIRSAIVLLPALIWRTGTSARVDVKDEVKFR
jgi:hypothetical protein